MGSIKNSDLRSWRARLERPALLLAVGGLAVGVFLALRERPISLAGLHWQWLLALLLAGVPLVTMANALRLLLSFRLAGQSPPLAEVLRASVLTSAANLLPLPGGVLLRIAYLKGETVSTRQATAITFGVASVWFALAAFGSGVAFTALDRPLAGAVLLAGGAGLGVAGGVYLSRQRHGARVFAQLIALESAVFVVQAFRFTWSLAALGYPARWVQGLALSVACVSGAIVSIVPAGLGVLEASAAALAPLAQLDPAVTFLAVFLDRIATMLGLGLFAGLLLPRAAQGQPGG